MPPLSIRKSPLDQKISEAGGPTPTTVLVVCGDMMRRSKHPSSARPEETERALAALSVESATQALASLDVAAVKGELSRAIEDAFEAAFAEGEEDRTLFTSSAMSGIAARDRVASTMVAAQRRLQLAGGADSSAELSTALANAQTSIAQLDRELSIKVRSLTAVNAGRRAELDRLDPEQRESAWWYAARSLESDDQLLVALSGGSVPAPAESIVADLAASNLPTFDGEDEMSGVRRAALRVTSPVEQGWLEHRASKKDSLRIALDLALDSSVEKIDAE